MGHLQQTLKRIRSTKVLYYTSEIHFNPEKFPPWSDSFWTNNVYLKVVYLEGNIYKEQKRRFPATSNRGNECILVAYHYDSNTIHAEELKTRKCSELWDQ